MTNSDLESSPTPSHSPKPRMKIIILFVCGQPSDVYISIGSLRRLIYYLFVDYPPMNINWAAPTIDIFNLDYPPIINIFRQPFEPFSLDSSHALTPIVLGCSNAYGMHVCQSQYSQFTCKYINMYIFTRQSIHTIMSYKFSFHTSKLAHLG